jgi:hypothetical protein
MCFELAVPLQVFTTMAEFLAANPRDVIVIGMSNINCGDKDLTRQQLLQVRRADVQSESSHDYCACYWQQQ